MALRFLAFFGVPWQTASSFICSQSTESVTQLKLLHASLQHAAKHPLLIYVHMSAPTICAQLYRSYAQILFNANLLQPAYESRVFTPFAMHDCELRSVW